MGKWTQQQLERVGGIDESYKTKNCNTCKYKIYFGHGYDVCLISDRYIELDYNGEKCGRKYIIQQEDK